MRVDAPTPCLGKSDLFFSDDLDDIEAAINLCGTCPVRDTCREWRDQALAEQGRGGRLFGVWAGRRETPMKPKQHPIACPRCLVRADQPCRTSDGAATDPHRARTIPRCCPCGGKRAPGAIYCRTCAEQRVAESNARERERARQAKAAA